MKTYRDESLGPESGDVTTWLYDESSGALTNKVYTDGKGPTYGYSPEGCLSRRSWARGKTTDCTYDAWGNVLTEECTVPALATIRYRFQGREWSAATGLVHFRMRWYDSETGRWLCKDPIGLGGGMNLFAFCKENPLTNNDSLGLWTFQIGVSGTGGAGNGGTIGFGLVFGYSSNSGFQFGAYGVIGDGAYISKGGGVALDITLSPNGDICDLNGVCQTIGGSETTSIGSVGGEVNFPLPYNEKPLPLPSATGSWGVSTPLPEVHTFTTASGIVDIWRSKK